MPTPDTLDARIRSLVTELIESTPQAPVLPQLEWGGSRSSAFAPDPREPRPAPRLPRLPRRPGFGRALVSTVVVVGTLAGIATLVAVAPRSRPPAALAPTHHLHLSGQPPAAVTGNEETIQAQSVPAFFYGAPTVTADCWIGIGTPESFTVDGSPPFVSWTRSGEGTPACPTQQRSTAVLTYEGNGLGNGTGVDSDAPATQSLAGAATSVFVVAQWPVAGKTVYVWSGLPADVAYVTYSFPGSTYWEVPSDAVAAFLVPQLFPAEAPFSVWHTTTLPVLRAYDADGVLIGTVDGPRVNGDDFGMSPTGAG